MEIPRRDFYSEKWKKKSYHKKKSRALKFCGLLQLDELE